MPNPKLGTLVQPAAIKDTIQTMKAGRVEYRCSTAERIAYTSLSVHGSWKSLLAGEIVCALDSCLPLSLDSPHEGVPVVKLHQLEETNREPEVCGLQAPVMSSSSNVIMC